MIPLLLLGLLLGIEGDCPGDGTIADLRVSVTAVGDVGTSDTASLRSALDEVRARVECLEELVAPEDAIVIHAMAARHAQAAGNNDAAYRSWLAVRAIPLPPGAIPKWLELPADDMPVKPAPWEALDIPDGLALFVDGVPASSRPVDRPGIYQAVGKGGKVLWTRYLEGEQDLPGIRYTAASADIAAGQELLAMVKDLLVDQKWESALEIAIPAASTYPTLEGSFRTAAALALDQLRRSQEREELGIDPEDYYRGYGPRGPANPRGDPRTGLMVGFEAGLPSGLRLEYKFAGKVVDGAGLRLGGNFLMYSLIYFYPIADSTLYVDFRLPGNWQLETTLGLFIYSGSVLPQTGLALQYDPPSPLQVNIGARLAPYGPIPDVNIGFLW